MSLSPAAAGILSGSISGAAMGFMVGGPAGAAVGAVAGGTSGYLAADQARIKERDMRKAGEAQQAAGIQNENAIVQQNYQKKKQAQGIGATAQGGDIASQSGAALTSPTGTATNLLG